MPDVPKVTLNNGVAMPQLGFGVFQVPEEDTAAAVGEALRAGYRSIDTAAVYGNERGVVAALGDSGLAREDVFVPTKLWNSEQGYDSTLAAFDVSMRKLGLDVLDLYLVHWPTPKRGLFVDTWRACERLYADGRVRAIGVSNFQPAHLERLAQECTVVPAVNQVELHPWLQQGPLREYHQAHGIHTEAWSPLAQGGLLDDPTIGAIAARLGVTPAQVVIRWHLQVGNVVIPKSVTPSRIRSNIDVFGFELSTDDLASISGLDKGERTGPDPDRFNAA